MRVFAVAKGPMQLEDVLDVLSGIEMRVPWEAGNLQEVLRAAHRLVISDGDAYVLVHPRLADHFEEDASGEPGLGIVRDAFRRWGARIVRRLNSSEQLLLSGSAGDRKECPAYLLHHYVAHLERDVPPDRHFIDEHCLPLLRNGWARAWFAEEGGWTGYLKDLDRTLGKLQSFNRDLAPSRPGELCLAEEVRCLLLAASVRSFAPNLPVALVVQPAHEGIWSLERAGLVATHYDAAKRAKCLTKLMALAMQRGAAEAADHFLERGLAAVADMEDRHFRTYALADIAAEMQGEPRQLVLQLAHQAALGIADPGTQAYLLLHLSTRQQGEARHQLLQQALKVAARIRGNRDRASTLHVFAEQLQGEARQQVLQQALQSAKRIRGKRDRADALIGIAAQLEGEARQQVLHEALQATVAIRYEPHQADALIYIAQQLQEEPALLRRTLQAAVHLRSQEGEACALIGIAAQLQGELRQQVLQQALPVAAALEDECHRARALANIAAQLQGEPLQHVLKQVLVMSAALQDEEARALALVALAARLPEESRRPVLQQALKVSADSRNEGARADVLVAIAAQLQGEPREQVLRQALQVTADIRDERSRADAVATVAAQMQGVPRQTWPHKILEIGASQARAHAHALVARVVQQGGPGEQMLQEALQVTPDIGDAGEQVDALAAIAAQLQGESRRQVLQQALQLIAHMGDQGGRARALGAIAVQLSQESDLQAECLKAVRSLHGDRPERIALCAVLAQQDHALLTYDVWMDLVRQVKLGRRDLLRVISDFAQMAGLLTQQSAQSEAIAAAVVAVGAWFP